MKLTNRKMVTILSMVNDIARISLPVKVSYAISKNIGKIEKELGDYNTERSKLLDKYAHKNEDGELEVTKDQNVTIKPENIEKWNKDINDLLDIEVEVDIHKVPFYILEESGTTMSISDIQAIEFMLED